MHQLQLLITRSIFSSTETCVITFIGYSIYKSHIMWSYILKNWPAIVIHHRTSSQLFLVMKSKPQSQKLTEYGLLKPGFGTSNLSFIYPSPTFKAIVISSSQALKLISETMFRSRFHLANFSLVLGSEVEVHPAFSGTALCTDVTCSPSLLTAVWSNATGLLSYYCHTGNMWATNEIFLTLSISND